MAGIFETGFQNFETSLTPTPEEEVENPFFAPIFEFDKMWQLVKSCQNRVKERWVVHQGKLQLTYVYTKLGASSS